MHPSIDCKSVRSQPSVISLNRSKTTASTRSLHEKTMVGDGRIQHSPRSSISFPSLRTIPTRRPRELLSRRRHVPLERHPTQDDTRKRDVERDEANLQRLNEVFQQRVERAEHAVESARVLAKLFEESEALFNQPLSTATKRRNGEKMMNGTNEEIDDEGGGEVDPTDSSTSDEDGGDTDSKGKPNTSVVPEATREPVAPFQREVEEKQRVIRGIRRAMLRQQEDMSMILDPSIALRDVANAKLSRTSTTTTTPVETVPTTPKHCPVGGKEVRANSQAGSDDCDEDETALSSIPPPPAHSNSSLQYIYDDVGQCADSLVRTTDNLLRILLDPQKSQYRLHALDGDLEDALLAATRSSTWMEAGKIQTELFARAEAVVGQGAREEVAEQKKKVMNSKKACDVLEHQVQTLHSEHEAQLKRLEELRHEIKIREIALKAADVPPALVRPYTPQKDDSSVLKKKKPDFDVDHYPMITSVLTKLKYSLLRLCGSTTKQQLGSNGTLLERSIITGSLLERSTAINFRPISISPHRPGTAKDSNGDVQLVRSFDALIVALGDPSELKMEIAARFPHVFQ